MKVKTPVPDWSGYVRGIYFARGVAECDDESALEWFRERGYIVEESEPVAKTIDYPTEETIPTPTKRKYEEHILVKPTNFHEPLPNLSKFSVEELREFMMRSGVSPGKTMSRSRLLQKIYDTWG